MFRRIRQKFYFAFSVEKKIHNTNWVMKKKLHFHHIRNCHKIQRVGVADLELYKQYISQACVLLLDDPLVDADGLDVRLVLDGHDHVHGVPVVHVFPHL